MRLKIYQKKLNSYTMVFSEEFTRSAPYAIYKAVRKNLPKKFEGDSIYDGDVFLFVDEGVESAYYVDLDLDTLVAMNISDSEDTDSEFNPEINEPEHNDGRYVESSPDDVTDVTDEETYSVRVKDTSSVIERLNQLKEEVARLKAEAKQLSPNLNTDRDDDDPTL